MKKTLKLTALLLALAMLFCACGNKEEDDETDDSFNYSKGITDEGFWEGVTATDYVTLPDLDNITVSRAELQVQIAYLLASYPEEKQITTRAVVDGDTLNIDYVGSVDGVEFEGGSTEGNGTDVTIGVTSYIDDFLEQLIGHYPKENFDINVTFPDEYSSNEELAGKDAVFNITINYIIEEEEMEWGDEFVTTMLADDYSWSSAEEAEAAICEYLAEENVYAATVFADELPQSVIDYQLDAMVEYFNSYASYYGVDLETFLTYYVGVSTEEELREYYAETCTTDAKYYLMYQAIAETRGISVSKDDITAYFKEMDAEDDYDSYVEYYGLPYITNIVLNDKVVELFGNYTLTD